MQQTVFTQHAKCFDLPRKGHTSKEKQKVLICSPIDTNQQAFQFKNNMKEKVLDDALK